MGKIKYPEYELQKLQNRIDNHKDELSKDEYIKILERSLEITLYMKSQLIKVRDFLMDKTTDLINQLETSKGMISDLDADAFGRSSLPTEPPTPPTIYEYLGMNFNKADEENDWMVKFKKNISKRYS